MTPKTAYAFIVLLLGSWILEFLLGARMINFWWGTDWWTWAWNEPGVHQQSMAAFIASFGHHTIYNTNGSVKRVVDYHWTEASVLAFLFNVFVAVHVIAAIWTGLLRPFFKRRKLGARPPSHREREAFDNAYDSITRNYYGGRVVKPRRWMTADGLGLQMRWIGYVLVIDRELLRKHYRHFPALLAHELGHVNSEDRLAHRLYDMLPITACVVGIVGGMPFALGHVLLFPFWAWYWKERIYAADAFAVKLGQGYALLRALDEIYLPLDQATPGGRWLKFVPYVEQRIDRLQQLMAQTATPGGPSPRTI